MSRVKPDLEYEALTECSYSYPAEVVIDIRSVTAVYRDLHLFLDFYCFATGDRKKLANLSGNIPISYEGVIYNIPVCIWLHETHPQSPPKCFVRPSVSMVINAKSSCVDASGQVFLHCLGNWHSRYNLSVVIEEMRAAFEQETPLFTTFPTVPLIRPLVKPPQSPLQPGNNMPTRFTDPYRPHFPTASPPYSRSASAQHVPALSSTEFPVSWEQPVSGTHQCGSSQHDQLNPTAKPRARKSYTDELLDLGITFGEVRSQSRSPSNPFTRDAAVSDTSSSGNSEDIDNLFKSLQLENVVRIYQLSTEDKGLMMVSELIACPLMMLHKGNRLKTERGDSNGQSDSNPCSPEGSPSPMGEDGVTFSGEPFLVDDRHKIEVNRLPVGIPHKRMKNKLTIYFQRKQNGGGEVLSVMFPTARPDQAFVTFRDHRDAERVLEKAERVITLDKQNFPFQVKKFDSSQAPIPDSISQEKADMFRSLLSLEGRSFSPDEVLEAVQSCRDLPSALRYLSHECPICQEQVSFSKIITMTHCPCAFCESCFKVYFSTAIKEKSVTSVVCPICNQPDVSRAGRMEEAMDYFSLLDTQIRHYLDQETHELFQRKLRDHALQEMPNFRWCAHCSFGLLHEADRLRMDCPSCRKSTCSHCRSPWAPQHEGLSCEKFREWQLHNNPEYQTERLEHLLNRNKIDCPKCKFRFFLSKGGCLHFKCTQCLHEFCGSCSRPFKPGSTCDFSATCGAKGLHAHHPRDCLYHLRDWSVPRLQQLLQSYHVSYTVEKRDGTGLCPVLEHKESVGLTEEACGRSGPPEYNGYCLVHYKERLVELVNQNYLDPAVLYDLAEAVAELQRWRVPVPPAHPHVPEALYLQQLRKTVRQEIRLTRDQAGLLPSTGRPRPAQQNHSPRHFPPDSQLLLLLGD